MNTALIIRIRSGQISAAPRSELNDGKALLPVSRTVGTADYLAIVSCSVMLHLFSDIVICSLTAYFLLDAEVSATIQKQTMCFLFVYVAVAL